MLLQSVLGVVPIIRYKVTDGTKEDSYIGNIGMVKIIPAAIFDSNRSFWPKIGVFSRKMAIFNMKMTIFGKKTCPFPTKMVRKNSIFNKKRLFSIEIEQF